MNYTANYNLKKPEGTDFYNVGDFNDNADTIDSTLHTLADGESAASLLNKIKTVDGVGSGLDAELFQGVTVIPIANGGTGASTAAAARNALEAAATSHTHSVTDITSGILSIERGGTGAATAEAARTALGITAAYIQQLFAGGTISVIKSIQRGFISPSTEGTAIGSILINEVNVNKTMVNLTGHTAMGANGGGVYLMLADSTHLSWKATNSGSGYGPEFTWEVVEFY